MAIAHPSSSTIPTLQMNDVYISFRGADTCNLVSHLYAALCQKNVRTYIDSPLELGGEISDAFMKGIQGSKLSIIIFSENFVDSRFCLEELATILDCKEKFGQVVVPVFYGVDPSHVRNQSGPYAAAFARLEKYVDPDKLQKWRNAMSMASQLVGWDTRNYRDVNLIETLTDDVLNLLASIGEGILANGTPDQSAGTAMAVDHKPKDSRPNGLSQLNDDCLECISKQVTYYRDFVALSEVSHGIRNALSNTDWVGPKPPCLMLSGKPDSSSRSFFNLQNNSVFVLDLPADVRSHNWGSSHGWLVTIDPQLKAKLVNPISQVCVDLPSLMTDNEIHSGNGLFMISKAFVFKMTVDKFLVMVIFHPENQLAFTRRGDVGWTFVCNPEGYLFRDISYIQGQDQVYALCDHGSLVRIEFSLHNISGRMKDKEFKLVRLMGRSQALTARAKFVASHPIGEFYGYQPQHKRGGRVYLVESHDGLFGVFRYSSSEDFGYERTNEFVVYKFNLDSTGWEAVSSIGDNAFFIGNGNSWSISPANRVNCKNNNIYFVDDMEGELGGLDIGAYDMETRQTECLGFGAEIPNRNPLATWITPGLTPTTLRKNNDV